MRALDGEDRQRYARTVRRLVFASPRSRSLFCRPVRLARACGGSSTGPCKFLTLPRERRARRRRRPARCRRRSASRPRSAAVRCTPGSARAQRARRRLCPSPIRHQPQASLRAASGPVRKFRGYGRPATAARADPRAAARRHAPPPFRARDGSPDRAEDPRLGIGDDRPWVGIPCLHDPPPRCRLLWLSDRRADVQPRHRLPGSPTELIRVRRAARSGRSRRSGSPA